MNENMQKIIDEGISYIKKKECTYKHKGKEGCKVSFQKMEIDNYGCESYHYHCLSCGKKHTIDVLRAAKNTV